MISEITSPAADIRLTWLTPEEGGRLSGPPTAPVYAANCAFPLGGESEIIPGWPATAEKFSILIQKVSEEEGRWSCKAEFLAPQLVSPYLTPQAKILVMEGPRVVAEGEIVLAYDRSE